MDPKTLVEQSADRVPGEGRKLKWRRRARVLIVLVKLAELVGKLADFFD